MGQRHGEKELSIGSKEGLKGGGIIGKGCYVIIMDRVRYWRGGRGRWELGEGKERNRNRVWGGGV